MTGIFLVRNSGNSQLQLFARDALELDVGVGGIGIAD